MQNKENGCTKVAKQRKIDATFEWLDSVISISLWRFNIRYITEQLHCGKTLMSSVNDELTELSEALSEIPWSSTFTVDSPTRPLRHQAAYNKIIETTLSKKGWHTQPLLNDTPRLIGDFAKGLVFVEVQFGNSATLYRDFYKFQFGLQNGLLSLAVLVVPHNEYDFFPNRKDSVRNMANFGLALRFFTVLPISVPTIIFGLLADHEEVSQKA